MSRAIYIHIGTGKTGTTALQSFFLINSSKLRRDGVIYPKFGLAGKGHHLLGHLWGGGWMPSSYVKGMDSESAWKRILSIYESSSKSVLISTEALGSNVMNHPERAKELKAHLEGAKVKIIVYLRRQDLHFESVYSQRVRGGLETKSFHDAEPPEFYDYAAFSNGLAEVFGEENIIVRPYERSAYLDKSIYEDFMSILGVSVGAGYNVPDKDQNPRLYRSSVEFLRLTNKIDMIWEERHLFNEMIMRLHRKQSNEDVSQSWFSPDERKDFLSKYEHSNAEVARRFLHKSDGVLFIEPVEHPEINNVPMNVDEVSEVCVSLWNEFRRDPVQYVGSIKLFTILLERVKRWILKIFGFGLNV